MPTYLQSGGAGRYDTRGGTYVPSTTGLITLGDGERSDLLDLITAGCMLLNTSGAHYYRLLGNPNQSYTASPSGAVYMADVNGLVLVTITAGADADSLVQQGLTLNGTC